MSDFNIDIINTEELTELYFTGNINSESAHKFCYELRKIEIAEKRVTIFLQTTGGCCASALRMYDTLINFKYNSEIICTGWVASSGTLFMLAANKIKATVNTFFLLHQFSSEFNNVHINNKAQLKYEEKLMNVILDIYKTKTNITISDLEFDTYLNTIDALKLNLINEIIY